MLYYFVIGEDGRRYGPADVDTLVQWAREGRLEPGTMLVDSGTETNRRADTIVALATVFEGQAKGRVEVDRPADAHVSTHDSPTPRTDRPRDDAGAAHRAGRGLLPLEREVPHVGPKSRVVAGLLGIFLGGLGIHRFYLGYTGIGLIMLLLSVAGGTATIVCMPGSGCGLVALWGFIEGVICLCGGMRDAEGRELA